MGCSTESVRTFMKKAFQATDVGTRAGLAVAVLRSELELHEHGHERCCAAEGE